jgi:hypothetical protein
MKTNRIFLLLKERFGVKPERKRAFDWHKAGVFELDGDVVWMRYCDGKCSGW